jgi:hypothetical protein
MQFFEAPTVLLSIVNPDNNPVTKIIEIHETTPGHYIVQEYTPSLVKDSNSSPLSLSTFALTGDEITGLFLISFDRNKYGKIEILEPKPSFRLNDLTIFKTSVETSHGRIYLARDEENGFIYPYHEDLFKEVVQTQLNLEDSNE